MCRRVEIFWSRIRCCIPLGEPLRGLGGLLAPNGERVIRPGFTGDRFARVPQKRSDSLGGGRTPLHTRPEACFQSTRGGGGGCTTRPIPASPARRLRDLFKGLFSGSLLSCRDRSRIRPGRCRTSCPCSPPTARPPSPPAAPYNGELLHTPIAVVDERGRPRSQLLLMFRSKCMICQHAGS